MNINIIKNKITKFRKAGMGMMALVFTGAVLYALWRGGMFLPAWIQWKDRTVQGVLGEYEMELRHKAVSVTAQGRVIWTSPQGVKVQDALTGDIDRDGKEEMILLCWKRGRYGRLRPFWVEKDEKTWSQHIFVYEFPEKELPQEAFTDGDGDGAAGDLREGFGIGEVRPKWMSSYIGQDVAEISIYNNGITGGRMLLTATDGETSCWIWDSWGFTKADTEVSFAVFGDNLIHAPIYQYGLAEDTTFGFLFDGVRELIADRDVAVIQQETPLVEEPSLYGDYPRFGTPIQVGGAIADAGFDVVTCGSNHALDRGIEGIRTTKDFFASQKIMCLGIQTLEEKEYRPYEILVRKGIRFALLNYTYGTNGIRLPEGHPAAVHLLGEEESIREEIAKAGQAADFVIIFVHWGTEGETEPDDFQRKWTEIFQDAGADVVVGTHPHVLQSFEMLADETGHEMLVYYSIGNYISAQEEASCVKGGVADFTVALTKEGVRVKEYTLRPLEITRQEKNRYSVRLVSE